jgi:NCAIR mutase (PurE)-related protein
MIEESRRVDTEQLRLLITAVANGETSPDAALQQLTAPAATNGSWVDIGFARIDTDRHARTGDPEVVFAAGKTPAQTAAIVATLRQAHPTLPTLVTRADAATTRALRARWPDVATVLPTDDAPRYNDLPTDTAPPAGIDPPGGSAPPAAAAETTDGAETGAPAQAPEQGCGCAAVNSGPATVVVGPWPSPRGRVVVVSAGTSDAPVADEAAMTARASGSAVECLPDVGVAGIHRLLTQRATLAAADCLIVVAGMEGALPSVVGGLVGTPVVAVPTSVGYGASFGGLAALLAMLNSCAPGVAVCNIDNGFGAGLFAARVARRATGHQHP